MREAIHRVWSGHFFSFPLFVIRNVEKRKRLRRALKVEKNCDLNVEFQRFNFGKPRNTANAKKTIIVQLFICKGQKIASVGYLENIADFL